MVKRLPVVAAIPNFNMAENLRNLIPQVLAQRYDGVFVLDDASTDHSVDVVGEYGGDVRVVRSPENRGAGANRNQIIDQVGDEAIIHFIDADMDLKTAETPAVARQVIDRYADRGVGVVGGLVTRLDGGQEYCNYGAVFSLWGNFTSNGPRLIDRLRDKPRLARAVHRAAAPDYDWLAQRTRASRAGAGLLGSRRQYAGPLRHIPIGWRLRLEIAASRGSRLGDTVGKAGH